MLNQSFLRLKCFIGLSTNLWHRLLDPVEHPQHQRTLQKPARNRTRWHIALLAAVLVQSLWICSLQAHITQLEPALLLMTVLVGSSSLYVGLWSLEINTALCEERTQKTYDVLCVLPSGAQGADWAVGSACLHRSDALGWITLMRKAFTGLLIVVLSFLLVTTSLTVHHQNLAQLFGLSLDMALLVINSYTEHTQSIVLGVLVSMLVSRYSKTQFDGQVWTLISFFAIQVVTLLLALLAADWVVIFRNKVSSSESFWYPLLNPTTISLLVFYISRICIIAILWNRLKHEWLV